MKLISQIRRQTEMELQTFLRNPTAAIFTLVFPLIFLIVGSFLSETTSYNGETIKLTQLIFPTIVAFGIFSANYTNLAMRMTMLRDQGVLKRVRGTPIPTWLYIAGHVGTAVLISIGLTAVLLIGGMVFYELHLPLAHLPALLTYLVLSSFTFCAMGIAVSGLIPNGDAAPAVVQVFGFIQVFLSASWTAGQEGLLLQLLHLLPLSALSHGLFAVNQQHASHMAFNGRDIAVLLIWGLALSLIAIRTFRWENSTGKTRTSRRRRPAAL